MPPNDAEYVVDMWTRWKIRKAAYEFFNPQDSDESEKSDEMVDNDRIVGRTLDCHYQLCACGFALFFLVFCLTV